MGPAGFARLPCSRLWNAGATVDEWVAGRVTRRRPVRCPLCGGPVHEADPGRYACEVGHQGGVDDLERHADHRLAEALWTAIEALHNEAEVLPAVRSEGDGR